jgi:hypothetical protein
MKSRRWIASSIAVAVAAAAAPAMASAAPFINRFSTISTLSSAVPPSGPAMGDQNPYGVAVVPRTGGRLVRGNVLVSNFNNSMNQQGTGSSIVQITPSGKFSVFAVVPQPTRTPAVGLTTALVALRSGYVIVGSLPAPGGDSTKATAGALSVLNSNGRVVETITSKDINGPWDMTAVDRGNRVVLFVTNVLNGTVKAGGKVVHRGTVIRIGLRIRHGRVPKVTSNAVIATGFPERTDPNALIIGPTGVGLGANGVLYVADSLDNRIAAVPRALTRLFPAGGGGRTLSAGKWLNDPLGLTIAPNGDVISANGGNGNLVETSPAGRQVAKKTLVRNGAGDLFGLAIAPRNNGIYFVNDIGSGPAANSLQFLH